MNPTNCTLLATALSTAYRSTTPFSGTTTASLQEYLQENGILFTMCLDQKLNCSLLQPLPPHRQAPAPDWSGSWGNTRLGFRPIAASAVGQIANPGALNFTCLYPTDGATDGRDGDGCGPEAQDSVYGSEGASHLGPMKTWAARQQIRAYMQRYFPGRTWQNISCIEFFRIPTSFWLVNATGWHAADDKGNPGACEAMKSGRAALAMPAYVSGMGADEEALNGEPVCTAEAPPGIDVPGHFPIYNGHCSWAPHEFQVAMDMMFDTFITKHPKITMWNEVVATKPRTHAEEIAITQALFFIVYPEMDPKTVAFLKTAAMRNAAYFGGKPVLEIDVVSVLAGGDLFKCAEGSGMVESEAEVAPLATPEFEGLLEAATYSKWYTGNPLPRDFARPHELAQSVLD